MGYYSNASYKRRGVALFTDLARVKDTHIVFHPVVDHLAVCKAVSKQPAGIRSRPCKPQRRRLKGITTPVSPESLLPASGIITFDRSRSPEPTVGSAGSRVQNIMTLANYLVNLLEAPQRTRLKGSPSTAPYRSAALASFRALEHDKPIAESVRIAYISPDPPGYMAQRNVVPGMPATTEREA